MPREKSMEIQENDEYPCSMPDDHWTSECVLNLILLKKVGKRKGISYQFPATKIISRSLCTSLTVAAVKEEGPDSDEEDQCSSLIAEGGNKKQKDEGTVEEEQHPGSSMNPTAESGNQTSKGVPDKGPGDNQPMSSEEIKKEIKEEVNDVPNEEVIRENAQEIQEAVKKEIKEETPDETVE